MSISAIWRSLRTRKDVPPNLRDPQRVTSADVLHMLVFDVLTKSPAAARVLIERGMACVGCTFARFDTVADAAAAYGCDAHELAAALVAAGRGERNSNDDAGKNDCPANSVTM